MGIGIIDRLLEKPWQGLAALCFLQVVLWTGLPGIGSTSPTLDVAEMLAWGQEWQLGYAKHPPLPAWIAEIARNITGEPIYGPILASQLLVATSFLFVFLLGRRLLGTRDALVGTWLLTGVYYFSWPTPELNHNVVQMPIWAAALYLFAVIGEAPRRIVPWLWLGAVAGIGIYAKYSVVILYALLALWTLAERPRRAALATPGPWLGALVALAIAAPHLGWLVAADFLPLSYAAARSAGEASFGRPFGFLAAQIANHLPMLVPLAPVLLTGRRPADGVPAPGEALRFLAVATFAPALLTAALALFAGAGLKDMWGAPMFSTSGLLAVALLRPRLGPAARRAMVAGALILLVVVPVAYALQAPVAAALGTKPPRTGWPMDAIAVTATESFRTTTEGRLAFVGGDPWLAALVSAGSPDRPSVVFSDPERTAPWATAQALRQHGLLLLWRDGDAAAEPPYGLTVATEGSVLLPWSGPGDLVLHYRVVAPASQR